MSSSIQVPQSSIHFKSYIENEDFLVEGGTEPSSRSQVLIFHKQNLNWCVKVTFRGEVLRMTKEPVGKKKTSKSQRCKEFQQFIRLIYFGSLSLLDNTVSEVILEESTDQSDSMVKIHETGESTASPFTDFTRQLKYTIREDPLRVIYPLCDEFPSFCQIQMTELSEQTEITDGVFHIIDVNDEAQYILKAVNRPLYHPHDTEVIRHELRNLETFRGKSNIVQPAGVTVATNPYATSNATEQPLVIFGILSVFYPGGSLQNLFNEDGVREHPWGHWTTQVATAINCLHEAGITHMDIKPSNVVIDGDRNAVLIDISGIGGTTHAWRAHEIRDSISPGSLSFKVRQMNDAWAYGKLLLEVTSHGGDSPFMETLNHVVACLTRVDTVTRMTLPEAVSYLKASGIDRKFSGYKKYRYSDGSSCVNLSSPTKSYHIDLDL